MKVSVIVATKNEEKNIKTLLASLKTQSEKSFETIIVDNYSQDKTVKIAKKYTPNVYSYGTERSAQRNFGLKRAKGEFVLFLDADMKLQKNVLRECLKVLTKDTSAIVIDEISSGNSYLAKIKNLEKKLYLNQPDIEAARFFRKIDLEKIGGYDNNLISGEDWDLTIRIRKFGKLSKIKSKILHFENSSIWRDIVKKYYYAKHILNYAKKNPVEYKKQSGLSRISILFQPKLILKYPKEFIGLLVLKTTQLFAYCLAIISIKLIKISRSVYRCL